MTLVFIGACGGDARDPELDTLVEIAPEVAVEVAPDSAEVAPEIAVEVAPEIVYPRPTGFVATDRLDVARYGHTATLVPDGRVVIIGGERSRIVQGTHPALDAIEAWYPATATWESMPASAAALSNHSATLLADGTILVVGGGPSTDRGYPSGSVIANAFRYDPNDGVSTATGSLVTARSHHVAVLLADGRVLIVGGAGSTHDIDPALADSVRGAEVFDPGTGAFTAAGELATGRFFHTAARLADGRVMVFGGANETSASFATTEIWDPTTNAFTPGPTLGGDDRFRHTMAVLTDGSVLVVAGKKSNVRFLSDAYRLIGAAWTKVGSIVQGGNGATLTATPDGGALFVGGYGRWAADGDYAPDADARAFDPTTDTWTTVATLNQARTLHTTTLLADGRLLVAGGLGPLGELATSEISTH